MAQSDYLPGTYSRVGTEENPGTFRGGSGGGVSTSMPPITVKRWVLENDRWNMRNYWISGGKFSIPAVWVLAKGVWNSFGKWMNNALWKMQGELFSTDNIWRDNFVWNKDLIWKI